jgi:T-complex protein 1 subunit epsilon
LHPLKIADGFDKACEIAMKKLDEISEEIDLKKDDNR